MNTLSHSFLSTVPFFFAHRILNISFHFAHWYHRYHYNYYCCYYNILWFLVPVFNTPKLATFFMSSIITILLWIKNTLINYSALWSWKIYFFDDMINTCIRRPPNKYIGIKKYQVEDGRQVIKSSLKMTAYVAT
jgi:hypothetical protein